MSWEAGEWFLAKAMDKITSKHDNRIRMDRLIHKNHLYKDFSCWFHLRRDETREVLNMLARSYDGVEFTQRGLRIPSEYLDRRERILPLHAYVEVSA